MQDASAEGSKPVVAHEPRWHASVAVFAALILYITLPQRLIFGPVWVAPVLVLALLIPLSIFAPKRHHETRRTRFASIALIACVNFFNIASVVLAIHSFLYPVKSEIPTAGELLLHGAQIWLTNILVFSLWFWELDAGGPDVRAHASAASELRHSDFLFPQMQMMIQGSCSKAIDARWKPAFLDYLYLGYTNSTAFSPADVMPLTPLAKMLMLLESLISLLTIAIVLARAVSLIQ